LNSFIHNDLHLAVVVNVANHSSSVQQLLNSRLHWSFNVSWIGHNRSQEFIESLTELRNISDVSLVAPFKFDKILGSLNYKLTENLKFAEFSKSIANK